MSNPDTRTGDCPACHRRDPQPEDGRICGPCQRWMPIALASIPQLVDRAREELIPPDDSTSRPVLVCTTCQHTVAYSSRPRHPNPAHDDPASDRRHTGWTLRRIVTHTGGQHILTGGTGGEAPVPLNLHLHDLLADVIRDGGRPIDITGDNWVPSRRDRAGRAVMVPAGDQIGAIPVAVVLDQEVRAWIDAGAPGSQWRPTPTVPELVQWLTRRLHWAFDNYPALDATLDAVTRIRGQLMGALGEIDPQPERCDGVACGRCDLRLLFRRNDGTGDVECGNPACVRIYTAVQYRELVADQAGVEREHRDPVEVAVLMRR